MLMLLACRAIKTLARCSPGLLCASRLRALPRRAPSLCCGCSGALRRRATATMRSQPPCRPLR
jgi:hypothetical protein